MKQSYEWVNHSSERCIVVKGLTCINRIKDESTGFASTLASDIVEEILRLSAEVDRLKALTGDKAIARSEHYARWADEAHIVFCHMLSHFNVGELKDMNLMRIIDKVRDLMWTCPGDIGKNIPEPPKEAE